MKSDYFISKYSLEVEGPNINRFIKRLKNNTIDMLNIYYLDKDKALIKIYSKDYNKVLKLKTIYSVKITSSFGFIKFKNLFFYYKYIVAFIIISLILIKFLSSLIFDIEIVTNDSKMKEVLYEDLNKFGIKKFYLKKSLNDIYNIKQKLLSKYKDKIEWIEIEVIGTKYIVRYEPRIKEKIEKQGNLRNIVSKKDALISSLNISSGIILKGANTYVKKGEIIVSSEIKLNNEIKNVVPAKGTVYGEVWYIVSINYPYKYYQKIRTGEKNKVLALKFLNNSLSLFDFKKYKTYDIKEKLLLKENALPIKLVYEDRYETIVINDILNKDNAIKKALEYSKSKISNDLKNGEYIKDFKIISETENEDQVSLKIFYSIIEDITYYESINE